MDRAVPARDLDSAGGTCKSERPLGLLCLLVTAITTPAQKNCTKHSRGLSEKDAKLTKGIVSPRAAQSSYAGAGQVAFRFESKLVGDGDDAYQRDRYPECRAALTQMVSETGFLAAPGFGCAVYC